METTEELIQNKGKKYPQVYWGKLEEYGLAAILLIYIERDSNIRNRLFPQEKNKNGRQRNAQFTELAKILFANIPEISVHLQNSHGLKHYTTSICMKLRTLEESFVDTVDTMSDSSHWPHQDHIESICPSFARLAPLLKDYIKHHRKFENEELLKKMMNSNLEICTTVAAYNPKRAAAQIAAQDAVLSQLQDPPRGYRDLPITCVRPNPNSAPKHRLPKPPSAFLGRRRRSRVLPAPSISSVTDPYANQSGEHEPQNFQQTSVSDTAALSAHRCRRLLKRSCQPSQQTSRQEETQMRSGVLQPPQHERAVQQISVSNLGIEQDRPNSRVHRLELEAMELNGKNAQLESIVNELMREKSRERPSQQEQQHAADELPLAKMQRRHARFEEPISQTPKNGRCSSNEPEVREAFQYLRSDRADTQDNPIMPTDRMPPTISNNSVASADCRQADDSEGFRPRHSLPSHEPSAWPRQRPVHVISSQLFLARLNEAVRLEQERLKCALLISAHQDEQVIARNPPTTTGTQVHIKDEALGSTDSPHFNGEDRPVVSSWQDLDEARVRTWRQQEVEKSSPIEPNTVFVKDESGREHTYGYIKQ